VNDENESVLLKLTRMEGKLDLSNLRHDQTEARLGTIDNRLNAHGERLAGIENREHERTGERKGIVLGGRLLWAAIGLIPGGAIVAGLMRLFGS
jgi:hypothetical protein